MSKLDKAHIKRILKMPLPPGAEVHFFTLKASGQPDQEGYCVTTPYKSGNRKQVYYTIKDEVLREAILPPKRNQKYP